MSHQLHCDIEACLRSNGAVDIRWLMRGADDDEQERIFQGEPHAKIKYGAGGGRFSFRKRAA